MAKKMGAREKHLIKLLERSQEEKEKLRIKMNEAKKDAFRYHEELSILKKKIADGKTDDVDVSDFIEYKPHRDIGKIHDDPTNNTKKTSSNSTLSTYMNGILGFMGGIDLDLERVINKVSEVSRIEESNMIKLEMKMPESCSVCDLHDIAHMDDVSGIIRHHVCALSGIPFRDGHLDNFQKWQGRHKKCPLLEA